MFAESTRKLSVSDAKQICEALKKFRGTQVVEWPKDCTSQDLKAWKEVLQSTLIKTCPLIVGVFADNEPSYVQSIVEQVGLDLIQLSGSEGFEVAGQFTKPTIKVCFSHTIGLFIY